MFKKTRIKIMIFITTTVMLLLAGTVGAISLSSYIEEYNQTAGPGQGGLITLFEYDTKTDFEYPSETDDTTQPPSYKEDMVDANREDIELQLSVIKRFVRVMIRNTFRIGIVIVIIVFILSYFISGWIIKPLEESYKRQKQFISDAGHELKTPVAAIEANAELLQGDVGENKWLENIRYESTRMTELIRQMLDLARTESVAPVKEEMNLSRIVMGSVLPYEGIAFEKGYEIIADIEEDISFTGDKGQMQQLSEILLDNAIDHAAGEGSIRISLQKEGSSVILSVSNPGEVIAKEDAINIFERFYRADKAHSANGHYGLGLAIAKAIVVAHRGTINVQSAEGENVFVVRL